MAKQVAEAASKIRKLLTMILRDCEKSRRPVAEILELLEGIERMAPSPRAASADVRRRNQATEYHIEEFQGNRVLAEYRRGAIHPFRCEGSIYDATAEAFRGQRQGLQFDELSEAVAQKLGERPREYQVRLCLRFWMRHAP